MNLPRATIYGFIIWLVLFIVGFLAFPLYESDLIFFKTIMIVSSTLVGMIALHLYLKKINGGYLRQGIFIGGVWFAVNLILDLIILVGALKNPLDEYLLHTGLRYLMIPIITIFVGLILEKKTAIG